MENSTDWERRNTMINELMLGRELAKQLQIHILNAPSSSSSHESRELLVQKILNSFEKVLNMLKGKATMRDTQQRCTKTSTTIGMSESPRSLSGSPRSEDSDREFRDQQDPRDIVSRKRKTMPRWTKHVRVCPGTGLEGPLDDGFNWRKYGQKDILGAKYPRGYYRCIHQHVQGCQAAKQVQRSNEDPTMFEVTYRGSHTCNQRSQSLNPPSALAENPAETSPQPQMNHLQETLLSFQRELKVGFSSTSTTKPEEIHAFLPTLAINNFAGDLSPPFIPPPATSGPNHFPVSYAHISSFAGTQNSYASESQTGGLDQMEFDSNFTFDSNSGFFS
ncbi:hypothetical protein ACH5RR_017223 [Cinchona calisaya]|uniref:WRKY domain-containing protein n=1 Tax=Cinchona calisaya TaxID=153742 RepID=A0ABD2ZZC8_9GENT